MFKITLRVKTGHDLIFRLFRKSWRLTPALIFVSVCIVYGIFVLSFESFVSGGKVGIGVVWVWQKLAIKERVGGIGNGQTCKGGRARS